MLLFEGVMFAVTVLTAVVKIVDMIVDKFWPESTAASVVELVEGLLDTADDVVKVVHDEVNTTGEGGSDSVDGDAAPAA